MRAGISEVAWHSLDVMDTTVDAPGSRWLAYSAIPILLLGALLRPRVTGHATDIEVATT